MSAGFGFSPVPKWRSKGVIGVALAGALIAETFVVASEAYAAPGEETPSQEEAATRGPDGVLQAPDAATASTIARLEGERVEIVGERTERSSSWALPDGTFAAGMASGPIWVRQGDGDGTSAADWAAVDLTLEQASDGTVAPKAHPGGLELAGEGTPEDGLLVAVHGPDGETVGLQWTEALPAPRLEGPRAIYPDVQPGVDMVVEATRTGYEQFFVLTDRPVAGEAPDLSLTVSSEGLTATPDADGGVAFSTPDGEVVGTSGTPLVWDAVVDAERQHPVTEPWSADAQAPSAFAPFPDWGNGEPQENSASDPVQPAPQPDSTAPPVAPGADVVEPEAGAGRPVSEEATAAGATPLLPLTDSVEVTAAGVVELALTPDAEFLADPETTYPVVVDPDFYAEDLFDTWVQSGTSVDQSGSDELRLGTWNDGATVARSFIHTDLTGLRGKQILSAELALYEWHSFSCAPANWEVWDTGLVSTATRFSSPVPWYGRWEVSSQTTGYSASCGDGFVRADVTNLFQSWVNHNAGVVSMGLKAENEADNLGWKRFNSADYGAGIRLCPLQHSAGNSGHALDGSSADPAGPVHVVGDPVDACPGS
ncbi:hypothetical protein FHU33_2040 [Blastococcus colisei]|uniref:DNRLRE domain-containing protein n=1 Tax=Blastococcus colisei TaxID=1564162 RepID=A0A543PEX3_9ACTN|nr:DNRLRE domain-containing protein [Blastococcus colisei]TQN42634.1 hypothetical protein FHU33_2040 [Blastococcus colisei]